MTAPATLHERVGEAVNDVVVGNEDIVESLTIALLTEGHVLLEGVPGVAKTTIAQVFAKATGLSVKRIQMTPDVLPADITGSYVYREQASEFVLREGPVFANVVIADEINRATPKTQSALLEAMQEGQVTIEGNTRALPAPFMLVATQNPVEMEGTFELPVAQRDRFQQKLTVDIPDRTIERELLDRFDSEPGLGPANISAVVDEETIRAARAVVESVYIAPAIKEYILDLISESRTHPDIRHGPSPRATITVMHAAKAVAAIDGREYVIPDDVKGLLSRLLAHRLVLETEAELSDVTAIDVIEQITTSIAPPSSEAALAPEAELTTSQD